MTIDDTGTPQPERPSPRDAPRAAPAQAARDLELYDGAMASRTRVMRSSAMRDLMAITARPEIISLAGGLPDTKTFPAESFASIMQEVAVRDSARALQYGPTEGLDEVRECVIDVMAEEGMQVEREDILVTTGGQQVIDLVCRTLIDPGDIIIAEAPTYPGAIPVFCSYEAEVIQIDMDSDGMRIDVLEETLDRLASENRRPKLIYTIPSFQNPAGATMSAERRRRLVEIANERELLILEDNPYGLLRYEGEPQPTLLSLDGGRWVIYLGTFSKILSPGLRLGWAVAPPPLYAKMNLGKQAADLCSASFTQLFVSGYFARGQWREYIGSLVDLYRGRRDAMISAVEEFFPEDATWTTPQGGLFLWVRLPEYIDTTDLLARALRENVAFVPGRGAYLDGRGGSEMRLNFSASPDDQLREGIRRIGEVVSEQVALYQTLTGSHPPAAPGASAGARGPDVSSPPAPSGDGEGGRVLPLRARAARGR